MSQHAFEELLHFCSVNERVCPQPREWQRLYDLLPETRRSAGGWQPALPLILTAWHESSETLKSARLREHIEWAQTHNGLEIVDRFLRSLSEERWYHIGE